MITTFQPENPCLLFLVDNQIVLLKTILVPAVLFLIASIQLKINNF